MSLAKILVVEDDKTLAQNLSRSLSESGYELQDPVASGEEALACIEREKPDLVLMDIYLKGRMDGLLVTEKIRYKWDLPVVILTGHSSYDVVQRAKVTGVQGYLVKPVRLSQLTAAIELALYDFFDMGSLVNKGFGMRLTGLLDSDLEMLCKSCGQYIYVSESSNKITGFSPLEFKHDPNLFLNLIHKEDKNEYLRQLDEQLMNLKAFELELRLKKKDGSLCLVSHLCQPVLGVNGFLLGLRSRTRDITEEKQLQYEKEKKRQMTAMTTMAAGVAHYYNNLLQGILGNAELGLETMDRRNPSKVRLERIKEISEKGAEFNHRILNCTDGCVCLFDSVDVSSLILEIFPQLQQMTRNNIVLIHELNQQTPNIYVDKKQLITLLWGLVANAIEAVEQEKGFIRIRTGFAENAENTLNQGISHGVLRKSEYVFIEVIDNGRGMSPEILKMAFDPFYSTKFIGRGLGLAEILGIVNKHKGAVNLQSDVNTGTKATVFLPVYNS